GLCVAGGPTGARACAARAGADDDGPGRRLPPLFPRRRRLQAMSTYERRRKRRNPWPRRAVWTVACVFVFPVGTALGQALEANPKPVSTVTQDHTYTLQPPAA